jgi:CubicO group peptidase (beta-lactamase class C family)
MLAPEQVASLAPGGLFHTRGRTAQSREWEGQQGYGVGDTVGLELDLRENGIAGAGAGGGGTLTAYKNGERLGVIESGLEVRA